MIMNSSVYRLDLAWAVFCYAITEQRGPAMALCARRFSPTESRSPTFHISYLELINRWINWRCIHSLCRSIIFDIDVCNLEERNLFFFLNILHLPRCKWIINLHYCSSFEYYVSIRDHGECYTFPLFLINEWAFYHSLWKVFRQEMKD